MRNKVKLKRVLFCVAIVSLLLVILTAAVSGFEYKVFNSNYSKKVGAIVTKVQEKYPDLSKNEIIDILNSDSDYSDLLLEYGIFENDSLVMANEVAYKKFLLLNIGVCLLTILLIVSLFLIFNGKKDKEIKQITEYIEQINRGNYILKIEENSEDELSILKNEIYKTTVMLREVAQNSKQDKIELKKSLSDISHQIKTPLTSILIILDNLIEDPDMDINVRDDFIRDIKRNVVNINFLVQAILKLSKFDSNTVHFIKKEYSLKSIIYETIKNVSSLCDLRNITIEVDSKCDPKIECDSKWQIEALTNILKNCIEHSFDNQKIIINLEDNNVYAKIEIKDFGDGISEKDIVHVFERFYRGENSSSDSIGIGLALAKTIIEEDNGSVSVESAKSETKFTIKYFKL